MPRRTVPTLAGLALAAPLLLLASPAQAAPSASPVSRVAAPYDFRGDGHPDLVVGAPGLQVGTLKGAGGVSVVEGSRSGLATKTPTVITQAPDEVTGEPVADGSFGSAVVSADFNHDGYADLAVGAPGGGTSGNPRGGTVTILLGSSSGLTGVASSVLRRAGDVQDDGFGASLAVGDFDQDGWADLAVGAPGADEVEVPNEDYYANGSVTVLRGGAAGFSTDRSTVLRGQRTGEDYDLLFGSSLAVGDVDGTTGPDLVVGSEGLAYEDGDGHSGAVSICPAGAGCRQVDTGYPGLTSLAVGNVSGSSRPEIVVGVVPDAGADDAEGGSVFVLSLSGSGSSIEVTSKGFDQDSSGVPGSNERGDAFGSSIALGDLDRDGYADLVIGSPGEDIGKAEDAGRVTVVYGGSKGYRTSGNKAYDQNTSGIPGSAEDGDQLGTAVALLDVDVDHHLDLAVGTPGENGTGAVTTLKGSGSSFTTKGSDTFGLDRAGYVDRQDAGFGAVLG